jgi:dihydrofolate reductase
MPPGHQSGDRRVIVSLIVAMDEQGGIGLNGRLPWHLSADLKRFKALTMGHHLIMGRKTYTSIGKALPGRKTIVITRHMDYQAEGVVIAHSLEGALDLVRQSDESEAFIAGGGEVFAQSLRIADKIYLTRVHTIVGANTFFPDFDLKEWQEQVISTHPADEKNDYAFTFSVLMRKNSSDQGSRHLGAHGMDIQGL